MSIGLILGCVPKIVTGYEAREQPPGNLHRYFLLWAYIVAAFGMAHPIKKKRTEVVFVFSLVPYFSSQNILFVQLQFVWRQCILMFQNVGLLDRYQFYEVSRIYIRQWLRMIPALYRFPKPPAALEQKAMQSAFGNPNISCRKFVPTN